MGGESMVMEKALRIFVAALALGLAACGASQTQMDVSGDWRVTETYGADALESAWVIGQNGSVLTLLSTRQGGLGQSGSGSVSGTRVSLAHACFAVNCGACSYRFTGEISTGEPGQGSLPVKMAGEVVYCPEDPAKTATGLWTADRVGSALILRSQR